MKCLNVYERWLMDKQAFDETHWRELEDVYKKVDTYSAERIQDALNKWKIEKLDEVYYRFCDIDDPDLDLILKSFNIIIPRKCFKISEVKQLKSKIEMSL